MAIREPSGLARERKKFKRSKLSKLYTGRSYTTCDAISVTELLRDSTVSVPQKCLPSSSIVHRFLD
jgi:hypothetical protein